MLFSAVLAGIKNPESLTLREVPIVEKGALLISVVSLIGLTTCILPFCLVSTLLINVALKSPQALRQHMRLFVRYTFLKLNESSDKTVD